MKQKITPISVAETLRAKNIGFFTPDEFQRIFHIAPPAAKYFLETYTRKGLFARLKKGLYILKDSFPGEEEIANALYKPSYISFEYALAKYGIMPEMVYAVTSATTKPTREFSAGQKQFNYFTIKKYAYTGYALIKEGTRGYLLAEPEKAFVDYLYFVSLGRKALADRLNTKNLKKEKVRRYAKLFKREGLIKLLEKYDYKRNS